ncbi:MAG: hypothetical protein GX796_11130, partial [Clostridiaceae bacterium]|nr:hypothetical protein [Clostridiaceae bacterium]
DEAMFCTKCGTKFENQSLNTDINTTQNTPVYTTPSENQVFQPGPQPSATFPPAEPSPEKKSKVLVYVLGLVAVVAVVFLAMNIISNANPANKLIKGLAKFSKMDKATSTTTIDINYDGDSDEIEMLKDVTIKLETAADVNDLLVQISLDLLYANKPVIQIAAGANNEDIYVDLKDLHQEKFYQEIEGLAPEYEDFVNDYKIIKNAFDGIALKFDDKQYIKIIKNVLGDDIKGSGNKVTVTLDSKTISKLTEKLLEEAEEDEKLMESIRKNGIDFIKRIIKEEKKLELFDVDDLDDALEILEDEDDFEDYYKEAISDGLSGMDSMDIDIDDLPEMEVTFRFGAGNVIKGIDYIAVIEEKDGNIEIITKTDIKNSASFTKINKKNAIEIEELMNGGDIEEVIEEITENLKKVVKKNKDLTKKIEELTDEDVDDAIDMIMYGAFNFAG